MDTKIKQDFDSYFDMVENKATSSSFYMDIKKYFEEGRIDTKTFANIMIEFNRDTLKEAINVALNMPVTVANVKHIDRQTKAIGEELSIKYSELALAQNKNSKELILYDARITTETDRATLIARQTTGFNDNLRIKKAEHSASLYGMIESGGNEAPKALVDLVMESLNDI